MKIVLIINKVEIDVKDIVSECKKKCLSSEEYKASIWFIENHGVWIDIDGYGDSEYSDNNAYSKKTVMYYENEISVKENIVSRHDVKHKYVYLYDIVITINNDHVNIYMNSNRKYNNDVKVILGDNCFDIGAILNTLIMLDSEVIYERSLVENVLMTYIDEPSTYFKDCGPWIHMNIRTGDEGNGI